MGKVLSDDTVLKCAATPDAPTAKHGGTLSASGTARLKVDGHKVLTGANVLVGLISSCLNDPNAGQVQCTKVKDATPGTAAKLKVDGEFVVIDTLGGTTNGNPAGTIAVGENLHSRLQTE
jgi:hypothetical protein